MKRKQRLESLIDIKKYKSSAHIPAEDVSAESSRSAPAGRSRLEKERSHELANEIKVVNQQRRFAVC